MVLDTDPVLDTVEVTDGEDDPLGLPMDDICPLAEPV